MTRMEIIADRRRLSIVGALEELGTASPADVAALAGVNVNTARAHLSPLVEAGLVERFERRSGGRGRPRVLYRLAKAWRPSRDEHLGLSELLAGCVAGADVDAPRLRRIGRAWGRERVQRMPAGDSEAGLLGAVRALGFRARVVDDRVELSDCPCPLASPKRPALICALADSVMSGAAGATAEGLRVASPRHDPRRRRCSARLLNRSKVKGEQ
jgi:predicted ArsR family transcriptional regulator